MVGTHSKIGVIGGGVMGLACAWHLARAGACVHLFDSRACGQGATLAALGALWPSGPFLNGPFQNLHRKSLWEFEDSIRELAAFSGVPIAFRRSGRLEFLNSPKLVARAQEEAVAACRSWPSFGDAPVMQYVDADELASLHPHLAPAPHGALVCRATAQVRVADLVAALRAACLRAGATLREHTSVTSLETANDKITAIVTASGDVTVDHVLITAGAWSAQLSSLIAAVAPIRPAKGQGIALRPPPPPAGVRLATIIKSGSIYLVPWEDEILVGSTTEPEAGFDETPSEEARQLLLDGAAAIVASLRGATFLRHWTGLRPQNPAKGHPPIMGPHPRVKNLYLCTGHFKTGIGIAPLVSRLISQAILEGRNPPELLPFLPAESSLAP